MFEKKMHLFVYLFFNLLSETMRFPQIQNKPPADTHLRFPATSGALAVGKISSVIASQPSQ